MSVLHVFRHRHLVLLWCSQLLSAVGDQLYEIAVVWIAVRLVASEAGVVLSAGAFARMLCGVFGGVYADRWDRRKTMLVVDLLRGGVALTLPLASRLGRLSVWHLAAATAVLGGLSALFDPALQASLPTVVPQRATLHAMNSLLDATRRLARIFGPGLAGGLVAVLPLDQFFTVDALTFGVSAAALAALRAHFPPAARPAGLPAPGSGRVLQDLLEAGRLTLAHRPFLWSVMGGLVMNLTWSGLFTVGLALFVRAALGASAGAYGALVAAYGVGNVLGALVVGTLRIRRRALAYFLGTLALGGGFLALAGASSLPLALVCVGVAALGGPLGDLPLLLTIQGDFPERHVGKIYSLRMVLAGIGASLGLLLATPVFAMCSPRLGIALLALTMLAVGTIGTLRWGGRAERGPSEQVPGSSGR